MRKDESGLDGMVASLGQVDGSEYGNSVGMSVGGFIHQSFERELIPSHPLAFVRSRLISPRI